MLLHFHKLVKDKIYLLSRPRFCELSVTVFVFLGDTVYLPYSDLLEKRKTFSPILRLHAAINVPDLRNR